MKVYKIKELCAVVLTTLLLGGIQVEQMLLAQPVEGAAEYHDAVRKAVEAVPYRIGDWVGEDIPVPGGAVAMLRPTKILSRNYDNLETGVKAVLLIVHCRDARDLIGHYPPRCYVGNGWVLEDRREKDWITGDLDVKGMEYRFSFDTSTNFRRITIANFMVLPNGQTARGMDEVSDVAQDRRRKAFGAAQFQVVLDSSLDEPVREEIVKMFLDACRGVLKTMLRGAK